MVKPRQYPYWKFLHDGEQVLWHHHTMGIPLRQGGAPENVIVDFHFLTINRIFSTRTMGAYTPPTPDCGSCRHPEGVFPRRISDLMYCRKTCLSRRTLKGPGSGEPCHTSDFHAFSADSGPWTFLHMRIFPSPCRQFYVHLRSTAHRYPEHGSWYIST